MIEITLELLRSLIHPRPEDGHKGTFGHALLVAGKYGMAGASVLAAEACMRSGVGKLTVHIPEKNNDILQIRIPEAILHHDPSPTHFTTPINLSSYDALCIGPGLGTDEATANAVHKQLHIAKEQNTPTIIDADALNILSMHPDWWMELPQKTVLTPHLGELKRLTDAGINTDNTTLVKKGHPTAIEPYGTGKAQGTRSIEPLCCPSGNNGMATAGSGDVLSGIILGLLAQGYSTTDAAILGVSLHAISGDFAAKELGHHSMIASDIVKYLGKAFIQIT